MSGDFEAAVFTKHQGWRERTDCGKVQKRKKKASKRFRDAFGHTPLSAREPIQWKCRRLVIGTGAYAGLPVMDDVMREAARCKVALLRSSRTNNFRRDLHNAS
jgi:hypothetical protein